MSLVLQLEKESPHARRRNRCRLNAEITVTDTNSITDGSHEREIKTAFVNCNKRFLLTEFRMVDHTIARRAGLTNGDSGEAEEQEQQEEEGGGAQVAGRCCS